MKQLLLDALAPAVQEIAIVLIVALVGAITELVRRYTGISIEAKHREALQSALQNGARLLIATAFDRDHAIDYVIASVPDALKALKVDQTDRDRIGTLLQPHVLSQKLAARPAVQIISSPGAGGGGGAKPVMR
ncbi:hypothetical protein [Pararhizobium sp.]|uniref:hypothetical protein n=1 Tax=Pararhizobium sp. TaxID=1977563 RepID=UPI003D14285C